jgi:hypothetical protein
VVYIEGRRKTNNKRQINTVKTMTSNKKGQEMTDWGNIEIDYDASELAEQEGSRSSLPALQVTNYAPKTTEKVQFALSLDNAELLSEESRQLLQLEKINASFKSADVEMMAINADVRVVVLKQPKIYAVDKENNSLFFDSRTADYKRCITIAWVILGIMVDDTIITDVNGDPQAFTLKLTSNKTMLIYSGNKEVTTIANINQYLQKVVKNGAKKWLTHLVSFKLEPVPVRRVSKNDSKLSSVGVEYVINDRSTLHQVPDVDAMQEFMNSDIVSEVHDRLYSLLSAPSTITIPPVDVEVDNADDGNDDTYLDIAF